MSRYSRALGLVAGLMSLSWLLGCGAAPMATAVPSSSLTGNWNIVGTGSITSVPSISFSLIAIGNQLFARGAFVTGCTGSLFSSVGSNLSLTGTLAADGSFQLTQPAGTGATVNGSYIEVSVNGKVPALGPSAWSGTYSITNTAGTTGCTTNETGSFTAEPYVPFTGTYTGPLTAINSGAGGVTVSVTAAQQSPAEIQSKLTSDYYLPVVATVTISGIPCFTQGATNGVGAVVPPINVIGGNSVDMTFSMSDGSTILLVGSVSDTRETALGLNVFSVIGGQCAGTYGGTLLRQ